MNDPQPKIIFHGAAALEGDVFFCDPTYSIEDAKESIREWVLHQDRFWPSGLSGEFIASNLTLAYAAFWFVSGEALGEWSASIGTDERQWITCSKCGGRRLIYSEVLGKEIDCDNCNGSGKIEEVITIWNRGNGMSHGILNNKWVENFFISCGQKITGIKKPDLTAALGRMKPLTSATDIILFSLKARNLESGKEIARSLIGDATYVDATKSARAKGDSYQDLSLDRLEVKSLDVFTCLYPVFAGTYFLENECYFVLVDGITRRPNIETPRSVRNQRIKYYLFWAFLAVAVILILITLIYFFQSVVLH